MITELPPEDHVYIFTNLMEIIIEKNSSSSSSSSNSRIIKHFISRNFSCSECSSRIFLSLNDFLNLKEFRMFRG